MASKDNLFKSGEPGVFYREHPTRKNGVRKDRQWIIVQKLGGKRRVSTLGWWSQGVSLGDAINKACEYRENFKWNTANPAELPKPICKQDEDDAAAELAEQLRIETERQAKQNTTFGDYFTDTFYPRQVDNGKKSVKREAALFKYHLNPAIGRMTFDDIKPFHVELIKKKMTQKGQSPRSIQYALSLLRRVWSVAIDDEITDRRHPIRKGAMPKVNNKRERFFTEEEEALLLRELAKRSPMTHDMAMMSVDTGARWSELAKLTWQNVDLKTETVRLVGTKAGDNRTAHIATKRVLDMLKRREKANTEQEPEKSPYVFPARGGGMQQQVNRVCFRTIQELGLNDAATDNSQRLSFHSLRHTCASRLAMAGVPLYTIKEIMGHHTITQTERYAHLMPSAMREALEILEKERCAR